MLDGAYAGQGLLGLVKMEHRWNYLAGKLGMAHYSQRGKRWIVDRPNGTQYRFSREGLLNDHRGCPHGAELGSAIGCVRSAPGGFGHVPLMGLA